MNTKNKCAVRSIATKEEAKNVALIKNRHIKGEIYITVMNFADYLRKSDVSENSKVYYGWFLRNGLHGRYPNSEHPK